MPPPPASPAVCKSYPRSDLVIMSHAEQDYYKAQVGQFDGGAVAAKTSSR